MGRKLKRKGKKEKKIKFSPLKTSDFFNDLETPKKEVVEPKVGAVSLAKGDGSSNTKDKSCGVKALPKVSGVPSLKPTPINGGNSYAGLFKDNRTPSKGMPIEVFENNDGDVILEKEDCVPIKDKWDFCLVGCFTGRFPGGKAVHDLKDSWGVACKVIPHTKYWTIFKFKSSEDRERVYQGGPYSTWGKTLMLKKIDDGTLFDDNLFLDIPIWVKFYDVPLNFWNPRGLGKIASKLGKPLYSDQVTNDCTSAKYARILVEVNMRKEPIFEYVVKTPWGPYTQKVCYEACPEYCFRCKEFGHYWDECEKLGKKRKNVKVIDRDASSVLELSTLDAQKLDVPAAFSGFGQDVEVSPEPVLSSSEANLPGNEPNVAEISSCVTSPVLPEGTAPTVSVFSAAPTDSVQIGGENVTVFESSVDVKDGMVVPEEHDIEAQLVAIIGDNSSDQDLDDNHSCNVSDSSGDDVDDDDDDEDDEGSIWLDDITLDLANETRIRFGRAPWTREIFDIIVSQATADGCNSIAVVAFEDC